MKLKSLLPWFGGKRTLAPRIVQELGEHAYYFEACAGSMSVLFAKEPAHHETVCDLHGALTNLAWTVQVEDSAVALFHRLQRTLYTDDCFLASKDWLNDNEKHILAAPDCTDLPDADWAYHYFICSWMGRNGVSGTQLVNYQIATRWTANGGSGPLRFKNAIDSIPAWCDRLRNVQVLRRDVFETLPNVEDDDGVAIYADPPYIEEGNKYLHGFKPADHARLADELRRFKRARIVVSYYANSQLQKLYPDWTLIDCSRPKHLAAQNRRGAVRATAPEVLLLNGPSLTMAEERDLFGANA